MLAVTLLSRLLGVDLSDELRQPEIEASRAAEIEAKRREEERAYHNQIQTLREALDKTYQAVLLAIEIIHPQLVLPSFQRHFGVFVEFMRGYPSADPDLAPPVIQRSIEKVFMSIPARHIHLLRHTRRTEYTSTQFFIEILDELKIFQDSQWQYEIESANEFLKDVDEGELGVHTMIGEDDWEFDIKYPIQDYVLWKARQLSDRLNDIQKRIEAWTFLPHPASEFAEFDNPNERGGSPQGRPQMNWRDFWRSVRERPDTF